MKLFELRYFHKTKCQKNLPIVKISSGNPSHHWHSTKTRSCCKKTSLSQKTIMVEDTAEPSKIYHTDTIYHDVRKMFLKMHVSEAANPLVSKHTFSCPLYN